MKNIVRVLLIAAGLALAPGLASADWQDNHWSTWKKNHHQDHRVQRGYHYGHWAPWWQHHHYGYNWNQWNGAHHFGRRDDWRRHDYRGFDQRYYKTEPRYFPRNRQDGDRR